MRDWLSNGGRAARLAGERPDLWLPGGLAALVYLGWLPLVLAVAPAITAGDVAYLGVSIASASAFPWNIAALAGLLCGIVLLACLLTAVADVAVGESLTGRAHGDGAAAASTVLGVIVLCAAPVAAAAAFIALGVATIGPGMFFSTATLADIAARLVELLWPAIAAAGLVVLLAQALGAAAVRAVTASGATSVSGALSAGLRDLLHRPLQAIGLALVTLVADLGAVVLAALALRALWAPIALDIGERRFLVPSTLALLVGFVAIWLALVLAAGALRTWLSAWRSLEIRAQPGGGDTDVP